MKSHTESAKSSILMIKVFSASLIERSGASGSINPFIKVIWNKEAWMTKNSREHYLNPVWNERTTLESQSPSELRLRIIHSGLFFNSKLIGEAVISLEELLQGKNEEWVDLYNDKNYVGRLQVSLNLYEEKLSEISTHNTSFGNYDLKEEYSRKLNELELEKEELEFYKRKYRKKLEKLNQEMRLYKAKVSDIIRKTTPKTTEESFSDEFVDI